MTASTGAADRPDRRIDLTALAYERFPAPVAEAQAGLGTGGRGAWRIRVTEDPLTGAPVVRVTVTDGQAAVALEACAQGNVTGRTPAPASMVSGRRSAVNRWIGRSPPS
ncbi:hypothetical protein KNE206_05770 [Kitasatospora sp. NE20-6]|uniref:hypothetical protein n=1 Tax=Kitasatospora sp. NE20-6 TaxID=2859066 RepID=UPI0034DC368F